MKKRTQQEIINEIKKQKPDRANVTFRLPVELMDDFKDVCTKNKVKVTAVLEKLIQDFITNS